MIHAGQGPAQERMLLYDMLLHLASSLVARLRVLRTRLGRVLTRWQSWRR